MVEELSHSSADNDFSLGTGTEDFKGINPDLWMEFQVRQCLKASIEDSGKYIVAVETLEGVMITKLDDNYNKAIKEEYDRQYQEWGKNFPWLDYSKFKFKELMKLIERKKPDERTLQI